ATARSRLAVPLKARIVTMLGFIIVPLPAPARTIRLRPSHPSWPNDPVQQQRAALLTLLAWPNKTGGPLSAATVCSALTDIHGIAAESLPERRLSPSGLRHLVILAV